MATDSGTTQATGGTAQVTLGSVARRFFTSLYQPARNLVWFLAAITTVSASCAFVAKSVFRTDLTPIILALCLLIGLVATLTLAMVRIIWDDEEQLKSNKSRIDELEGHLALARSSRGDLQAAAEQDIEIKVLSSAFESQDVETFAKRLWDRVLEPLKDNNYFRVDVVKYHAPGVWKSRRRAGAPEFEGQKGWEGPLQQLMNAAVAKDLPFDVNKMTSENAKSGQHFTRIIFTFQPIPKGGWFSFALYVPHLPDGESSATIQYVADKLPKLLNDAFRKVAEYQLALSPPSHAERVRAALFGAAALRQLEPLKARAQASESALKNIELDLTMAVVDSNGPASQEQALYKQLAQVAARNHASYAMQAHQAEIRFAIPFAKPNSDRAGKGILGRISARRPDNFERALTFTPESTLSAVGEFMQRYGYDPLVDSGTAVLAGTALDAYHRELIAEPLSDRKRILYHVQIDHPRTPAFWDGVKANNVELVRQIQAELWAKARALDRPLVVDDEHGHYYVAGYDTLDRDKLATRQDALAMRSNILHLVKSLDGGGRVRVGIFRCCERTGQGLTADQWQQEAMALSIKAAPKDQFVCIDERVMAEE